MITILRASTDGQKTPTVKQVRGLKEKRPTFKKQFSEMGRSSGSLLDSENERGVPPVPRVMDKNHSSLKTY